MLPLLLGMAAGRLAAGAGASRLASFAIGAGTHALAKGPKEEAPQATQAAPSASTPTAGGNVYGA